MTPEENRAKAKAWYEANRERALARQKVWRDANPDRLKVHAKAYRERKPEVSRERSRRRRARVNGSVPDLTVAEWLVMLEEFDHCCAYCQARGLPLEQDHMTPLVRDGRHTRDNVVPACRSCNARKGAKTLFEFAAMG